MLSQTAVSYGKCPVCGCRTQQRALLTVNMDGTEPVLNATEIYDLTS